MATNTGLAQAVADLRRAAEMVGHGGGIDALADAASALEDCWLRVYLPMPEQAPAEQRALDAADRAVSAAKAALESAAHTLRQAQRARERAEWQARGAELRQQMAEAEAAVEATDRHMARMVADPLHYLGRAA